KASRETYLDCRSNLRGVYLKLLARSDTLELHATMATSAGSVDAEAARCKLCDSKEAETLWHFMMRCPALQPHRNELMTKLLHGFTTALESGISNSHEENQQKI